ncbi:hypothetical protein BCY91_03470 [Pelobium manganitolerans]|uniref:Uncharacterized protein n=1 Tax=Pelobium manganitolerans TaxID=1842495 RepID=A0A419S772_9SPHI|nr:hypothetical protein [Pelobium manganitolerans]RKD17212.1 hypothetical protein BCY91_03470 [Pelobium manganitolerans]
MTVKYIVDENGKKTGVQLSLEDYYQLLESANILPEHVKKGIEQGRREGLLGLTKSTDEVMKKYSS